MQISHVFSLQGVPQEKPFPVFGSVGGSQLTVLGLCEPSRAEPSRRRAREGEGRGSQCTAPPPQRYVTTTQALALILLVSFIRCQDCFKKFPWPQFKQEYSWDVLDFRQSALNLR